MEEGIVFIVAMDQSIFSSSSSVMMIRTGVDELKRISLLRLGITNFVPTSQNYQCEKQPKLTFSISYFPLDKGSIRSFSHGSSRSACRVSSFCCLTRGPGVVPDVPAAMRLTAELIQNSLSYLNPLKERELDLRGAFGLKRADTTLCEASSIDIMIENCRP